MRKILVALALIVVLVSPILAAPKIQVMPRAVSVINLYDLADHELKVGGRYSIVDYNSLLYFDFVAVTDLDTSGYGFGANIDLITLIKMLGVEMGVAENLHLGFLGGYNVSLQTAVYGPYVGVSWQW